MARQNVPEDKRQLAYEELLIAEGSDWNWWYGPEHGSENRPEFDQLYRDHLKNVYRALGLEASGGAFAADFKRLRRGRASRGAGESDSSRDRWRSNVAF